MGSSYGTGRGGAGLRRWALALLAVLALAVAMLWRENPATQGAEGYAGEVAAASAAVYVTLRTLNAVLSSAQEVEVGAGLIVEGSAQPLKVLEPVDDTVERIAGVVFGVMVLTGVLAVAMGPVWAVGWSMVAAALAIHAITGGVAGVGRRLLSYGGFLALALPAAFVLSALVADRLTQDVWDRHSAVVSEIAGGVEIEAPVAEDDEGYWEAMRRQFDRIADYTALAGRIYERGDELIGSFIAILAVFVFKIFVLPALLAGAFLVVARGLARPAG
ncbi:hypothetical protein DRV85_08660 [Rhodosalinus halophilus]|uniref:Uncharacterized protein n=1 Tax=Rhodosalinus halophilus TaxID=2259333 RepID=A0A365UBU9_9RHOB|nr:hypothetical protein [Rhodosalinus halophilus]RBI85787.1 hypothetical protein DRV85_08660 [Rhodosalinus halophilus]